jgi:hypothetical protein
MSYTNILAENVYRAPSIFDFPYKNLFYSNLVLSFNMEAQTQTNWCWAATSKSVSHFYSFLSPWTQCKIASSELNTTCCTSPVPGACNVPWYLDKALTRTQNFVSIQAGTVSWSTIKSELEKGLVVGARIGWNGGGGHFMAIHGVTRIGVTEYLHIDDPIYGKSFLTYNQFATNYQGSGSWTHTYFTKKKLYIMWLKDLLIDPVLLKPIPEVRPVLQVKDAAFDIRKHPSEAVLSMPHHAYVMGLDQVTREAKLPADPSSLRVVELADREPLAIYEVGLNANSPEFIQLNSDKGYLREFDGAVQKLSSQVKDTSAAEIRVIRVPALNIEAAWLHYDEKERDRFSLLRHFNTEAGAQVYSEKEFFELLNRRKAELGEMDDLMGA